MSDPFLPVLQALFDDLARDLLRRVDEAVAAGQMTVGTVVGKDGEKVRVRLDDEDEDRVIGFTRALGVAYDDGDRVPVGFSRAGVPTILGVAGGGGDHRVRNAQLDTDSVDDRAIKKGSIRSVHISGEANIARAQLDNSLRTDLQEFVKEGQRDEDKIVRKRSIENFITMNQASGQFYDQNKGNDLEDRVAKLEKAVKEKDKGSKGGKKA